MVPRTLTDNPNIPELTNVVIRCIHCFALLAVLDYSYKLQTTLTDNPALPNVANI